ncbi:MAG: hypothetical protein B6D64_02805 [Bacteroidetes bacterium 4484_276]|nr:MAG: hypothetical protein B6D64_02805 [Bacteroidetes bacterium 4484_276]
MAGKVLNIKVCSPLKLRSGLTGNYHAICHYSYNLPLPTSQKKTEDNEKFNKNGKKGIAITQKQESGCPTLFPSLSIHTLVFLTDTHFIHL